VQCGAVERGPPVPIFVLPPRCPPFPDLGLSGLGCYRLDEQSEIRRKKWQPLSEMASAQISYVTIEQRKCRGSGSIRLKEAAMSGRVGVVIRVLGFLALAVGVSPLLAAEPTPPSEADIGRALRPVPKGLGTHQGIPTLGTVPGATENPNVHGASIPSSEPSPASGKPKMRAAAGGTTSHGQPSTEPRPAMAFNTIQFAFDSAVLTPESSQTLHNLGLALNHELADQKAFLIEGHTDAAGSRQYNTVLSRRRAQAVKDYLAREAGVSPSRLQIVGKGPSEPANRADPYAAENRRVVVVNLGS
jgi:outer membrane protein OmpA-like peptidoglycan-associated protein